MERRYTPVGILNLHFYNKCFIVISIVVFVVFLLMVLVVILYTDYFYDFLGKDEFDLLENNNYSVGLFHSVTKMGYLIYVFRQHKEDNIMQLSDTNLEIIWTIIPVVVLLFLLVPSLNLLYYMDDARLYGNFMFLTWRVTGHQWYWQYTTLKHNKVK
jgi:heme/copper-type cytochrome/quinol oxidase subunit 2